MQVLILLDSLLSRGKQVKKEINMLYQKKSNI